MSGTLLALSIGIDPIGEISGTSVGSGLKQYFHSMRLEMATQLEKLTKKELLALASKKKIKVTSAMLKKDILQALKKGLKEKPAPSKAQTKKAASKITKRKGKISKGKAKKTEAGKTKRGKIIDSKKIQPPTASPKRPHLMPEAMALEAKFLVGSPTIQDESSHEITPELPQGYGYNKIVLLARDPYGIYCYWELQAKHVDAGYQKLGKDPESVRAVLRVHPLPAGVTDAFDIDIDLRTLEYNLKLSPPGASFRAEIGLLEREGRFVSLAASNIITLPVDRPTDRIDELWMTTDEEFKEIFILSGGSRLDRPDSQHSRRIQKIPSTAKSLEAEAPGSASDSKSQTTVSNTVNAEVILYGRTDPEGAVSLDGSPVRLRDDGTFSVRVALPEGQTSLPVTFTSPCGEESQKIVPVISRKTQATPREVTQ
jgi:hypothetical protein